ncbi:MAG: CRISPR-associated ring nuclease Csm6, partial [Thermodesulfobacteriota bacterium]|nr:CRISPR-associated ring nuclease Csm6 [Thermodesulfobacteriota bacterium]
MKKDKYREILIFVAGTTPQIITETLYGLILQKKPPVCPDEIFILTTETGRKKIQEELIRKERLAAFQKEFKLKRIPFAEENIIVLTDFQGSPLDDIRGAEQNEAVGDLIADFIRKKAGDPASRLHCSLAGGRKTMSFYLGSALQLFGRPWDRLYHVLVSPEFESHPEFFYKPKKNRVLFVKDSKGNVVKKLNTKDANIFLAEIPFLSLSGKLSLNGKKYGELIAESQREINAATVQLPLKVDFQDHLIEIGDRAIEMVPMQLVVYSAFLREKLARCRHPERELCLDCTDCFLELVDLSNKESSGKMAEDYRKTYSPKSSRIEDFLRQWPEGMDVDALRQHRSKINRTLKEDIGSETLLPFYQISAVGKHGNKRYGVRIEKIKIFF